jgi:AcrR family transcriptional regulator
MAKPAPISTAHDSTARILNAATALFAEHGFHGVSTRALAAAVGLNIATVHHHVGSKGDLYLKVMERLYEEEREIVASFVARIDEALHRDAGAVRSLLVEWVDTLIDLTNTNPARARLYMHRWLETDELTPREVDQTLSLYGTVHDLIRRTQDAGVIRRDLEPRLLLRSVDWLVYGYFVSGTFDAVTWRVDPQDPENLEAFKSFMHDYVRRMLGL